MFARRSQLLLTRNVTLSIRSRYDATFPSKADFLADVEDVKSRIELDGVELVFSHNDILIKNIVLTPDKSKFSVLV